jgi:O-antigen ligase
MFKQLSPVTRRPWFATLDLACALTACGLWFLAPAWLPWTLPLSLALVPWILRLLFSGRLTRRTPFDWPLALFLVTAVVAVWAAYDRTAAWQKFWLIVGAILLFYALANARALWPRQGPAAADWRLWGIAALAALLSLYFMATHDWSRPASVTAVEPLGRWLQQRLPDLPGHRFNPNIAGGILAAVVPYVVALGLSAGRLARRPRWGQLVALLLLSLILLGLLLTASRGAWLALAAAAALFSLWQLSGWLSSRGSRLPPQTVTFALSLLFCLALSLLLWRFWPDGRVWLLETGRSFLQSDLNRLALWRGGLVLASDYPFTGGGLDSFMMLYSTYSLMLHVGHSFHAHNLYLDVALEQGVAALLLLGWLWLLLTAAVVRWLNRPARSAEQDGTEPRLVYPAALGAAALSLLIMLLHGLVDDPFYGSRALVFLFVPLAFAVPRPPRRRAVRRRSDAGWATYRWANVRWPNVRWPTSRWPNGIQLLARIALLLTLIGLLCPGA